MSESRARLNVHGYGLDIGKWRFPWPLRISSISVGNDFQQPRCAIPMSIGTKSMTYDGPSSPPRPFLILATGSGGVFELFPRFLFYERRCGLALGKNLQGSGDGNADDQQRVAHR